jgi:hypothetical protein
MPRGEVDPSELNESLPSAYALERRALQFPPDFIAIVAGDKKSEAIVCLRDAAGYLAEGRSALLEAHLHWQWHSS